MLKRFGEWFDLRGNRINTTVQILLLATQTGLLLAAIIGFFYTVVPLYSKAVLEEGIAQKELELKSKAVALSKVEEELRSAKQHLDATNSKLQSEYQSRRRSAITFAARDLEVQCSGMMTPLLPLPKFGDPPQPDRGDASLSIPIDECLRDQLKRLTPGPTLTADDIARLKKEVESAIPALEAKRGDAAVSYQTLKQEHALARKQLMAKRQAELNIEGDQVRKRAMTTSAVRELQDMLMAQIDKENAVVKPYRKSLSEAMSAAAKSASAGM